MNKQVYPTRIHLKELPPKGEHFHFSEQTGELNSTLGDLLKDLKYSADIRLEPAGNAFQISGSITTKLDVLCSRCGRDMVYPVNDLFNEIIVINTETPRDGHLGHVSTSGQNEGPYCNYINNYDFDLAEFIHEHIAAAEPYTPHCERPDCETHWERIRALAETPAREETTPFAALKKMSIKPQKD